MARSIVLRLGSPDDDSVPGFERAAVRCFHDAGRLRICDRRLAAIYFYGYSVEMWIKAAYFRTLFLLSGCLPRPGSMSIVERWPLMSGTPSDSREGLPLTTLPDGLNFW